MGESKIIVVANQKGGVGKSTVVMLLANYLVQEIRVSVGAIIDTDFQKSVVKMREENLVKYKGTNLAPMYQVVEYPLDEYKQIPRFIAQLRETRSTYIIDTPGTLTEQGIFAFIALADYVICPLDFDKMTLSSTTEFLIYWDKFKASAKKQTGLDIKTKVILVPCRKPKAVGTRDEIELWNMIKDGYAKLYYVVPEIPQSADIRRCDTMAITPAQLQVAGDSLSEIAKIIYDPNMNEDGNKEQS